MCSVVGYVGSHPRSLYVLEGLKKLEYRGYDSAGFACFDKEKNAFLCWKTTGDVAALQSKITQDANSSFIGLGHTRWATHGVATELNAHPHYNTHKTVFLVHNGIIENHAALKASLIAQGHRFYSDTDSEVIAHLFEQIYHSTHSIKESLGLLAQQLKGSYACVLMTQYAPDALLVLRKSSPLCIGIGNNEAYVASDTLAFPEEITQVLFMPDQTYGIIKADQLELFDFDDLKRNIAFVEKNNEGSGVDKGAYPHFMLKEIYEQKRVLEDTVLYMHETRLRNISSYGSLDSVIIAQAQELLFIACGTSANAASIATYFFEEIARVRTRVNIASEFVEPVYGFSNSLIACSLSQSGETADTLEATRALIKQQVPVIAISNVLSSTLVRECGAYLITQARREVAVAATKSFTAQLGLLFLWAHQLAFYKHYITYEHVVDAEKSLLHAAEIMSLVMDTYAQEIAERLAPLYASYKNFVFLGRHISYPFACEAALKLKEIAYVFVDAYPAGELKHGPLALVDETIPVVIFSVLDEHVYRKLVCAAQEVKARNGHVIVFAFEGQDELLSLANTAFVVPCVHRLLAPLAMTGLVQLFVYNIARELARPIDRPRNLAKSVTVQ